MPSAVAVSLARVRATALLLVVAVLVAGAWLDWFPGPYLVSWLLGMALIVALLRVGTLRRAAVVLRPPVTGRWLAHNSPATRVPSHGIQSYGQAYAIDLVADPADGSRPGFAWWPPVRHPDEFPGFGAQVYAPCEGTVVRVHDRERDHYSRTSPFGIGFLLTVELFREFFGPSRILGNHVVIDLGDGTFAALAHLERRSIRVREGDRVAVGERIADCGNSGNSSEPHLHLQVMDHPRPGLAAGVPFRFMTGDGAPLPTPPNGAHLEVATGVSTDEAQEPDRPSAR